MPDYYLRIEGVNLDNYVYDTNDLNTIRGGGLLLLEAINTVKVSLGSDAGPQRLRAQGITLRDPETITSGASWGLIRFGVASDAEAAEVARAVYDIVNGEATLKHATFVVDVLSKGKDSYVSDRNRLTALNRWRQMQSTSVAVPAPGSQVVCQLDRVRPAVPDKQRIKQDWKFVSKSVLSRRDYGKDQKTGFYKKRTHTQDETFVEDFDELTAAEDHKSLHHKMAVIYLDGNGFGALQRRHCKDEKTQRAFDQYLRKECQQGALTTLLSDIKTDADWKNGNKIRLETLLWGGDEVIWVVPAWKAWWMLGSFFRIAEEWSFKEESLTHAGGLVFCHHNAPIRRIKDLAKRLGDVAKEESRDRNLVAYQVLESFDHAGNDLTAFRNRRCPAAIKARDLLLDGNGMLNITDAVSNIRKNLPKRQLHRLVQSLYADADKASTIEDDFQEMEEIGDSIDQIKTYFGGGYACWLHLFDLWDYITESNGARLEREAMTVVNEAPGATG